VFAVIAVIAAVKLASGMNGDSAHATTVSLPGQVLTQSAFSPDGHQVATLDPGGALSWRSANDPGKVVRVRTLATHDVRSGVMSSDGTRLATIGSDGVVQVWDTESGRAVVGGRPSDHYHASTVSLSSDGNTMAVQGSFSNDSKPAVRVWSVSQARWLATPQPAASSGLSANGGTLVLRAADGRTDTVSLRSTVNGKQTDTVTGCDGIASLTADGGWLVCTGGSSEATLHRTGNATDTIDLPDQTDVSAVATWSGDRLALAGRTGLSVLDLSSGQPFDITHVDESLSRVRGLTFDQDGGHVAVVTQEGLTVVDLSDG
jgi:WD40 repeat protein